MGLVLGFRTVKTRIKSLLNTRPLVLHLVINSAAGRSHGYSVFDHKILKGIPTSQFYAFDKSFKHFLASVLCSESAFIFLEGFISNKRDDLCPIFYIVLRVANSIIHIVLFPISICLWVWYICHSQWKVTLRN